MIMNGELYINERRSLLISQHELLRYMTETPLKIPVAQGEVRT
jgi:hypothetical protein